MASARGRLELPARIFMVACIPLLHQCEASLTDDWLLSSPPGTQQHVNCRKLHRFVPLWSPNPQARKLAASQLRALPAATSRVRMRKAARLDSVVDRLVLRGGIEPPTSPLPMECSTTELPQQLSRNREIRVSKCSRAACLTANLTAFCHSALGNASAVNSLPRMIRQPPPIAGFLGMGHQVFGRPSDLFPSSKLFWASAPDLRAAPIPPTRRRLNAASQRKPTIWDAMSDTNVTDTPSVAQLGSAQECAPALRRGEASAALRRERQALELRHNLARRKAQSRKRQAEAGNDQSGDASADASPHKTSA